MRLRFLPPLARGWVARVGRREGLWTAVLPDGAVVAAAPTRRALAELAERMGGRLAKGAPPKAREIRAHGTSFALGVWKACREIPAGATLTYGQLAGRIGTKSARAIGQALRRNPLAGLIPCHRVVGAGGLGGFAWGAETKSRWLARERRGGHGRVA